jgi:asparagine synthase (glutamine-hydrolysing)
LAELFEQSIRYRLQADVPVGFYLSGGLDSALTSAVIQRVTPDSRRHSFSIGFSDRKIDESKYQKIMSKHVDSIHHETMFDWPEVAERLRDMIYHCECPVKETYNTCSMALSESARREGITVVLSGEGADELFAGYVGYRIDQFRDRNGARDQFSEVMEEEIRERLWGDPDFFYEKNQYAFKEIKQALFSEGVNAVYHDFDCLQGDLVNKERMRNRHPIHRRSYLDFKLRLSDHLLSDHGDRMALANSIEGRYPFLDVDLIEFSTRIPPDLKLKGHTEKYVVRKMAEGLLPKEILHREKFGFRAPGSPYLLESNIDWINDLLSYERIKRQGYFNPDVVERMKKEVVKDRSKLNPLFDDDFLTIVLTFNIFLDVFDMPDFG